MTAVSVRREKLTKCIKRIRKSLGDAALVLAQIRDEKLYKETHGTFEEFCRAEFGWGRNYVNKQIKAAEAIQNLGTIVPRAKLPSTESQARELSKLQPEEQVEAWQNVLAKTDKPTAAACKQEVIEIVRQRTCLDCEYCCLPNDSDRHFCEYHEAELEEGANPAPACDGFKKGEQSALPKPVKSKREILTSSESDEWYTPSNIVQLVHHYFGGPPDLDPASCEIANKLMRARTIFTAEDNGLSQEWKCKTLFLNPPYSEMLQWVEYAIEQYDKEHFADGLLLVKADCSTQWWQLLGTRFPVCCIKGRQQFSDKTGKATFGSMLFRLGSRPVADFKRSLSSLGPILSQV